MRFRTLCAAVAAWAVGTCSMGCNSPEYSLFFEDVAKGVSRLAGDTEYKERNEFKGTIDGKQVEINYHSFEETPIPLVSYHWREVVVIDKAGNKTRFISSPGVDAPEDNLTFVADYGSSGELLNKHGSGFLYGKGEGEINSQQQAEFQRYLVVARM